MGHHQPLLHFSFYKKRIWISSKVPQKTAKGQTLRKPLPQNQSRKTLQLLIIMRSALLHVFPSKKKNLTSKFQVDIYLWQKVASKSKSYQSCFFFPRTWWAHTRFQTANRLHCFNDIPAIWHCQCDCLTLFRSYTMTIMEWITQNNFSHTPQKFMCILFFPITKLTTNIR